MLTYDASGNTTSDLTGGAGNTYTYDKRGRYSTLTTAGSVTATYLYDAVGERVSKQTGGSITHYQYDEDDRIIGENNGSTGANIREYIYLNNQPLAQIESGGSIYYIHNDHLGTPQKMTDATPAIVWDRVQQPFGETWSVTGSVVNNFRFPGQYYDAESGLSYNMMRDYQSGTGRYIQSDPIGLIGAYSPNMNLYGYASQNPVRYIDRYGQQLGPAGPAIGGIAEVCLANPALCRTAATALCAVVTDLFVPANDNFPIPATPPAPPPPDDDECVVQFEENITWCDNNFRGRRNISCHALAKEELHRCRDGESSQPFRG